MTVTIEIRHGAQHSDQVYQEDVQVNIDALKRAIDRKPKCNDDVFLLDTLSIIESIQKKLPRRDF